MAFETLLYDVRDHVAYVTLNRPEVMNAISYQMTREIIDVGERITGFMSHRMTFSGQEMFALIMLGAFLLFAPLPRRYRWIWLICAAMSKF